MWIIDNILRGLQIMMKLTLFIYAFIHLYFNIKSSYESRKKW